MDFHDSPCRIINLWKMLCFNNMEVHRLPCQSIISHQWQWAIRLGKSVISHLRHKMAHTHQDIPNPYFFVIIIFIQALICIDSLIPQNPITFYNPHDKTWVLPGGNLFFTIFYFLSRQEKVRSIIIMTAWSPRGGTCLIFICGCANAVSETVCLRSQSWWFYYQCSNSTIIVRHHIHTLLVSGNFIFSSFLVRFWLDQLLIYYQCTNPTIIVRQHDQGASTCIIMMVSSVTMIEMKWNGLLHELLWHNYGNNSKSKYIYIYGVYIFTRMVETWTILCEWKKKKILNKIQPLVWFSLFSQCKTRFYKLASKYSRFVTIRLHNNSKFFI